MTLQDLGSIGEFLGAVGVTLSLIDLALLFKEFENAFFLYRQQLISQSQCSAWAIAIGWYVGFPGVHGLP